MGSASREADSWIQCMTVLRTFFGEVRAAAIPATIEFEDLFKAILFIVSQKLPAFKQFVIHFRMKKTRRLHLRILSALSIGHEEGRSILFPRIHCSNISSGLGGLAISTPIGLLTENFRCGLRNRVSGDSSLLEELLDEVGEV